MVSQTGPRVVRSNFCKGSHLPWKRAKKEPKGQNKILGQQVLFGTEFLKFGPKRAKLATLFVTDVAGVICHCNMLYEHGPVFSSVSSKRCHAVV